MENSKGLEPLSLELGQSPDKFFIIIQGPWRKPEDLDFYFELYQKSLVDFEQRSDTV
jgi:hypothetical protein